MLIERNVMSSGVWPRYSERKRTNPVRSPSCKNLSLRAESCALTVKSNVMFAVVGGRGKHTLLPVTQSADSCLQAHTCCSRSVQTVQFKHTRLCVAIQSSC